MVTLVPIVVMTVLFSLFSLWSSRRDRADQPAGIFLRFWPDTANSLLGSGLVVLLGSMVVSVLFVKTGWDYSIQKTVQSAQPLPRGVTMGALLVGNFWTVAIGAAWLWWAKWHKSRRDLVAAIINLRATFASVYLITLLKIVSGRRGPAWLLDAANDHVQRGFFRSSDPADFDLAFWQHSFQDGRFFWPSGHTAAAVTMVSAFVAAYPKSRWISWVGYPLAAFMGLCMIAGNHHWASDVVAGAAIAHIVAWRINGLYQQREQARLAVT